MPTNEIANTDRLTLGELPRAQASWVAVGALAAAVLALSGTWSSAPSLGLSIALAAGVAALNPRMIWALPLVAAGVVASGMIAESFRVPAVLGAGAASGLALAALLPLRTDLLDHINAALASAAGASFGLWGATVILPDVVGSTSGAMVAASFMCLGASQGMLPLALRQSSGLPTAREIQRALTVRYRPPVFRAIELHQGAVRHTPDPDARKNLIEVVQWVFRLQQTIQEQDGDLAEIDPIDVNKRITEAEQAPSTDAFTRERRQATARHLRRLLAHREAIATERERQAALVEYALAFLEEARAGAAVGRELPGEATPDRLGDVLTKLRTHAAEGEARRRTSRELQSS